MMIYGSSMVAQPTPHEQRNVAAQLEAFLGAERLGLIRHAAAVAAQHGATAYVVGGTVRDMLLDRPHGDLDLVVEGNAVLLAQTLADDLGGTIISYAPFGTATWTLPNGVALDFVMARRERYPQPAALPQVEPAALADDLFRRDFTVNALAVGLSGADYGRLFDMYGGLADLHACRLRVLHDESFVDDPTRILRAVRLAARLGFALEPHTRDLAMAALQTGMWERTTPQRLANELQLLFHEPQPERAIAHLAELGALPHLLPSLGWSAAQAQQFAAARQARFPNVSLAKLYAGITVYPLTPAQREALIARYQPPAPIIRLLHDLSRVQACMPDLRAAQRNSQIDHLLHDLDETALRVAQIVEPEPVPRLIARYLPLRDIKLAVDGSYLLAHGLTPGPQIGRLLAELRAAKLDGLVPAAADEVRWIHARLQSLRSSQQK
jgi:tRNA nucleotidyltransferase (CCA-adding enzyme)